MSETAGKSGHESSQDGVKSELSLKWRTFGRLWAEPFNATLLIILFVMYGLGLAKLDGGVGVLAQTVLALASGVLGGRIANAVSVVNSEAVLKARGTVAVRGLNLMLGNVRALEKRVAGFMGQSQDRLEVKNYEEVQQMCRVLSEEGITSIENWTDIVPEAREASLVGVLSKLQEGIEILQVEKAELKEKLESATLAGAEVEGLKLLIASKDEKIASLGKLYSNAAENESGSSSSSADSLIDSWIRFSKLASQANSSGKAKSIKFYGGGAGKPLGPPKEPEA